MITEGNSFCSSPPEQDLYNKIEAVLTEVNKPSRYVGHEIGSTTKKWDDAIVKAALAFPDLYEIGISNLGLKILYHIINNNMSAEFIADRVYAPDADFKIKLLENNIPLYGVENFKPLKEFDLVTFSLSYELSYPTILSMLEMAQIPVKSIDRSESDPLIIAGGQGSYNPEPMAVFIDAFTIGDGEEVNVELLQEIKKAKLENLSREETLKRISKIHGIYVPRFYKSEKQFCKPEPISAEYPEKIQKRISYLEDENCPKSFAVPYMLSVHDRAVVEIRRGCNRMCRFCQSCFVNLPVRERAPENIVANVQALVESTGYDEYSLLSLSASDYKDIKDLISVLNQEFQHSGTSVSLPSQRADAFSVELATLVQSVRKSTLTFAPEAGSQRLRDVVNKNLTEEQILNAVFSAYRAGWNKVKLYFMIGLPTETFEDLDEIEKLISKIKSSAKDLKNAENINKHLDITCTISLFVPKPFTPFQWVGQDSAELIDEKIKYLRQKVKFIKGVKFNFHDVFLSQLEAVFSRGDRKLNELIELVYKKGSYLDAWSEYFNRKIWYESAQELNLNFEDYSTRNICLDSELPWDIINVGVDKAWLANEYQNAFDVKLSVSCDEKCTNCGVCSSLHTKPVIKSKEIAVKDIEISANSNKILSETNNTNQESYKYRAKIQKTGLLKYISHLDWNRLIYKAVRKAGLKVCFSQGFNPSPKLSLGVALPLFVESLDEYFDIELEDDMQEIVLQEKLNKCLPESSRIEKVVKISKNELCIEKKVQWAKYTASPICMTSLSDLELNNIVDETLSKEKILIDKKTKKGSIKTIDIKSHIHSIFVGESNRIEFVISAGQRDINSDNKEQSEPHIGSLRPDKFLQNIIPNVKWKITREKLLDCNFKELF